MTETERRNLTQPRDWWSAFERAAKREGLTLSEWMGECCKANVSGSLSDRNTVGRPAKPKDKDDG